MQSKKKIIWLAIVLWLIFNRGLAGNIGYLIFDFICTLYIIRYGINGIITKYTLPLLLIPIFPLVMGICGNNIGASNFDIFKDLYYFLNPVFAIIVGQYIAMKYNSTTILKALKKCGVISSMILALSVALTIGIEGLINAREARVNSLIAANSSILLACAIYWFDILYERKKTKKYREALWGFFICLLGVYLSGTRTLWITEIIFMIFIGWKYYKKHHLKTICISFIVLIGMGSLIISNQDNRMVQLILNSSNEMSSNHSFNSDSEINKNWRGYEAYRALNEFNDYSILEKIIGHGFGTTVDMRNADFLGIRRIPILHNGFVYMLIKSGILGLFLFGIWGISNFIKCQNIPYRVNANGYIYKALCLGSIVMLFITNSTVTCYVNVSYNGCLFLIGSLYYNYSNYQKSCRQKYRL